MSTGFVLSGPTEVAYGRLASLKGALKLESKGLKSRGGALRRRLAKEFGLKPRDPYEAYIAHCETKMQELFNLRQQELAQKAE